MHPRNIFKDGIDIESLMMEYPTLKNCFKKNTRGNNVFDFKNGLNLALLNECCLKKYFNLNVQFLENKLVPTLPSRLNYIHWIEDLLNLSVDKNHDQQIYGLDIGSGSVAIYALIGCSLNPNWNFICYETDEESYLFSKQVIKNNKLEERIQIEIMEKEQSWLKTLFATLNEDKPFINFVMMNPPFYNISKCEIIDNKVFHSDEYHSTSKQMISGTISEREIEGGEYSYVSKLLNESFHYAYNIGWFTAMFGKKASFLQFKKNIQKFTNKDFTGVTIKTIKYCIFSQGKIRRWAIAWSFIYESKNDSKVESPLFENTSTSWIVKSKLNSPTNFEHLSDYLTKVGLSKHKIYARTIKLLIPTLEYPKWHRKYRRMKTKDFPPIIKDVYKYDQSHDHNNSLTVEISNLLKHQNLLITIRRVDGCTCQTCHSIFISLSNHIFNKLKI